MRKIVIMIVLCSTFLVSSCSKMQVEGSNTAFSPCDGLDFSRSFPGVDKRPTDVGYDTSRKILTGKEGVYYYFHFPGEKRNNKRFYEEDIDWSKSEKKYLQCYREKETLFDDKYAGNIKEKLKDVSENYVRNNGRKHVVYPVYLEGESLPEGLKTPCSFFDGTFISYYIKAINRPESLRNYILSTELIKDFAMRDVSGSIAFAIAGQVRWRHKAVFGEYILTYYYLKEYRKQSERKEIWEDLALYFGELAYRSAAEALYEYKHLLTMHQRKKIAEYVYHRVVYYILSFNDKFWKKYIKEEYNEEISDICSYYILRGRYKKSYFDVLNKKMSKEEYRPFSKLIHKRLEEGSLRCVND